MPAQSKTSGPARVRTGGTARGSLAGFLRARLGSTAMEFAFAAPVLMLVLVGTEEVGRALWVQGVLQYASEKAARCGALASTACNTVAKVTTLAATYSDGVTLASTNFSAAPAATCGYQVSATYTFASLVPAMIPYSFVLTASSCYPL